jgi:hypothetical protein
MEQHLIEAVSEGVATLTLNRPERLNALSTPIMEGLLDALPRLARLSRRSGPAPGRISAALSWIPQWPGRSIIRFLTTVKFSRRSPSIMAIFLTATDPAEERINERVHWSVIAKHQSQAAPLYSPPNYPADIPADKIAAITDEERELLLRPE